MADSSLLSLARIATTRLERLWHRLAALPPKVRVLEEHVDDEEVCDVLGDVLGQPAWLVCSLVEAVLSERGTFEAPVSDAAGSGTKAAPTYVIERHYGTRSPDLVWSGETGARSRARLTRFVIGDLFASVQRSVFIAGYSFYTATELFTPLFRRADELAARGDRLPRVRVVLDCSSTKDDEPGDDAATIARRAAEDFRSTCWRQTTLEAELFYYEPSTERRGKFAPNSMHAKCIVVDEEVALVGSANFSTRGRDNRSLEVGALIRDHNFVQSLLGAWRDVEHRLRPVP